MKDKIKNIIIDSYNKALRERKEFYLNGAIFQVINPITNALNVTGHNNQYRALTKLFGIF